MPQINQEGTFRARILDVAISPQKTGSKTVMMGINFAIEQCLINDEWQDWQEYMLECYGNFCVIKKDGKINETTVTQLRDGLGWNGQMANIDTWQPPSCQIKVEESTYNNKVSYRAAWINHWDAEGGLRRCSPAETKGLDAQYGSELRALCGERQIPFAPPTDKPSPPAPLQPTLIEIARNEAWDAFTIQADAYQISRDDLVKCWNTTIAKQDKRQDLFDVDDWKWIQEHAMTEVENAKLQRNSNNETNDA